jgi:hypothetical protein
MLAKRRSIPAKILIHAVIIFQAVFKFKSVRGPKKNLTLIEIFKALEIIRPVFDDTWYLENNKIGILSRIYPSFHYLSSGSSRCRSPHPLFDDTWYLSQHPEVKASGENPLLHYMREGAALGYSPSLIFNSNWYLHYNTDVNAANMNPLVHFVKHGVYEGRSPNPFDEVAMFQALAKSKSITKAVRLLDWRHQLLPQDGTVPFIATFDCGVIEDLAKDYRVPPPTYRRNSFRKPNDLSAFEKIQKSETLSVLPNVTVIGGAASFIFDQKFYWAERHLTRINDANHFFYKNSLEGSASAVIRFKRKSNTFISTGIYLISSNDHTLTGFICEVLPRFIEIHLIGIRKDCPLIVSKFSNARNESALKNIFGADRSIIEVERNVAYNIGSLFFAMPYNAKSNSEAYNSEQSVLATKISSIQAVREHIVAAVANPAAAFKRRIYIRPNVHSQRPANEEQIIRLLIDNDFEVIHPENFSFEVQVKLYNSSSVIITYSGDELVNSIWSRAETQIIILHTNPTNIFLDKALEYVIRDLATIKFLQLHAEVNPEDRLNNESSAVVPFEKLKGMVIELIKSLPSVYSSSNS